MKLVGAMIGFARAMGIRTVAAGVETAEQTASLHKMGCEQAQSFYSCCGTSIRPVYSTLAVLGLELGDRVAHTQARVGNATLRLLQDAPQPIEPSALLSMCSRWLPQNARRSAAGRSRSFHDLCSLVGCA